MRKLLLMLCLLALPCYAQDFEDYYKSLLHYEYTLQIPQQPRKDLIKVDEGYNNYRYVPNYMYLNNLPKSKMWDDYIKLKLKEYKIINKDKNIPTNYHYEGITYDIKYVPKWIIQRRKFLTKYPDFPLRNVIEDEIYMLLIDLMDDKNQVWIYTQYSTQINENIIKYYKYFLKHSNKDTFEYEIINKWYCLLQENNFKMTIPVTNYLHSIEYRYQHE